MEGSKLKCLRCGEEMEPVRREYLQLGRSGWITDDLSNLLAGGLDVVIWACPRCGKLEFFSAGRLEPEENGRGIAETRCSQCGREYELDDPKCPFCGATNTKLF